VTLNDLQRRNGRCIALFHRIWCLFALPTSKRCVYAPLTECVFYVDGKPTEFLKLYFHLRNIINARMVDGDDICHRRGTFIGQVNNVLCHFSALNFPTNCRLFQSYCTSFMVVNYGVCLILRCRISARRGERASVRYGNCHIAHIAICFRYCATAYLFLTKYVHDHLILSTDVFHMTLVWSDLFLSIG